MSDRNLLGVHIITCNEEMFLGDCLSSVQHMADEIIVVDTGSSDKTKEIARTYSAKMIETNWDDDFSGPRNTALFHALTEWILVLDADEVCHANVTKLRELLATTDAEGFSVLIESDLDDNGIEHIYHSNVRLFRHRPEFKFEGRIHEQIATSILTRGRILDVHEDTIKILHRGYRPSVMDTRQKTERNLKILHRALKEHPDDPFYMYHLGVAYSQLGDLNQSKECLCRALSRVPSTATYRPTLVRDTVTTLLLIGDVDQANLLVCQEIENYPNYPDLHFLRAQSFEKQGYLVQALETYERATQCPFDGFNYATLTGVRTFQSLTKIGELSVRLHDYGRALRTFEQALTHAPDYEPAVFGLAEALYVSGVSDSEISAHLTKRYPVATSQVNLLVFKALVFIGAFGPAYQALLEISEVTLDVYPSALKCYLYHRNFTCAKALMEKITLVNQSGLADLVTRDIMEIDFAISCWAGGAFLPSEFYGVLPFQRAHFFCLAEEGLKSSDASVRLLTGSLGEWFRTALSRIIFFDQLELASKIESRFPELDRMVPGILYERGYAVLAANRLLDFMKQRELSSAELSILGEVLSDKGHYEQALEMFERGIADAADNVRCRVGAAKCYLCLAQNALRAGLQRYPHHPTLTEDLHGVQENLYLLDAASTRPRWTAAERRNRDARAPHFPLHDCEKRSE